MKTTPKVKLKLTYREAVLLRYFYSNDTTVHIEGSIIDINRHLFDCDMYNNPNEIEETLLSIKRKLNKKLSKITPY